MNVQHFAEDSFSEFTFGRIFPANLGARSGQLGPINAGRLFCQILKRNASDAKYKRKSTAKHFQHSRPNASPSAVTRLLSELF